MDLSATQQRAEATHPIKSLDLRLKKVIGDFVWEAVKGEAREIACFGARGDGKTIGALIAMIMHAQEHLAQGFSLPVPWMGVTDTFQSHKLKTHRTMLNSIWQGGWQLHDGGHLASFHGLVALDLFGIEDVGAMDRVRMETVGMWFEEPAPSAVLVQSSGISDTAWLLGLTSQRVASYKHPALMTLNYPDEDHWTWERFVIQQSPGTAYFRIPPGERASEAQRREWQVALQDRPDLLKRLLDGQPGTVVMGPQVAIGFNSLLHVSDEERLPIVNEPLFLGWDFGHTPTVIIGQLWRGFVYVYWCAAEVGAGVRQLISNQVQPWLTKYAPFALRNRDYLLHGYDPSGNTQEQADIDQSPIRVIRDMLGGQAIKGPVSWQARKDPMLALFNRAIGGMPTLRINKRGASQLIKALDGRWYYPQDRVGNISRDLPKKPNHPWEDYGDSFCYLVSRMTPTAIKRPQKYEPVIGDETVGY